MEPDNVPYAVQEFDFSHAVATSGTVSFDWGFDASIDSCCSGFNFYKNGVLVANLTGGTFADPYGNFTTVTSGSFSTAVNAGDIITFGAFSADGCCGASTNTVSNFSAPGAVPEPATWAMMLAGLGLVGYAMRKRATVRSSVTFA